VLKQDQNAYGAYNVMDTVIMGNQRLYDIGKEKEALYAKEEMTDEDGLLACQLEEEYAELGGWEAESDASRILQGLGIGTELHYNDMATLDARLKVKVLLAQALFGSPDLLMMDEPTNNLDIDAVNWLEDFLLDFEGTVIVVSHDSHFLNTVCTHIVDIDYGKIKMYVGNYDFWYESSQLVQQLIKSQNKRNEEKIKELQDFISRFSANKSKSKQATARRKLLDKLTDKEQFYALCDQYGVAHPATFVYDQSMGHEFAPPFGPPYIAKPADSVAYWACGDHSLAKVYICQSWEELLQSLEEK